MVAVRLEVGSKQPYVDIFICCEANYLYFLQTHSTCTVSRHRLFSTITREVNQELNRLLSQSLNKIQILCNAPSLFVKTIYIHIYPPLSLFNIAVVKVNIEEINKPGKFYFALNIRNSDLFLSFENILIAGFQQFFVFLFEKGFK
jgi:hypothetical protein